MSALSQVETGAACGSSTEGKAVRSAPQKLRNAADVLYATGHRLTSERRIEDAATIYRSLVLAAPHDERGWLALGALHESKEQFDVALELYGVGAALVATSVRCDVARARLLGVLGRVIEANSAIERALMRADASGDESLVEWVRLAGSTS